MVYWLFVPSIGRTAGGRGIRNPLPRLARSRHSGGFALIAVIWSLGLITLLSTAIIVGARYRTRIASNDASVAAAESAAESAVNLAIATALGRTGDTRPSFPMRCRMPGGEHVLVTVEEENGKIDLNTSSPSLLVRFFVALTHDAAMGARIAEQILRLRSTNAGGFPPPPGPGFMTIMQLDQIDGVSPRLFRAALPLVTVRSGRTEPDMDAAPAAMRRLLALDPKPVAPARGMPAAGTVTFRADIRGSDGARYIREALVSLADGGRPFLIREWRRGDIDPAEPAATDMRDRQLRKEGSCFQAAAAGAS